MPMAECICLCIFRTYRSLIITSHQGQKYASGARIHCMSQSPPSTGSISMETVLPDSSTMHLYLILYRSPRTRYAVDQDGTPPLPQPPSHPPALSLPMLPRPPCSERPVSQKSALSSKSKKLTLLRLCRTTNADSPCCIGIARPKGLDDEAEREERSGVCSELRSEGWAYSIVTLYTSV